MAGDGGRKKKKRGEGMKSCTVRACSTSAAHVRWLLPWCAPGRGFSKKIWARRSSERRTDELQERQPRVEERGWGVVSKKEGGSPSPPGLQKIQS